MDAMDATGEGAYPAAENALWKLTRIMDPTCERSLLRLGDWSREGSEFRQMRSALAFARASAYSCTSTEMLCWIGFQAQRLKMATSAMGM